MLTRPAVPCPTTVLANTNGDGTLSGSTAATLTITCADGYSIGGGINTAVSQVYTCQGTAAATSAWSPSPATTSCQRA
jgi:hypothetical protein